MGGVDYHTVNTPILLREIAAIYSYFDVGRSYVISIFWYVLPENTFALG